MQPKEQSVEPKTKTIMMDENETTAGNIESQPSEVKVKLNKMNVKNN